MWKTKLFGKLRRFRCRATCGRYVPSKQEDYACHLPNTSLPQPRMQSPVRHERFILATPGVRSRVGAVMTVAAMLSSKASFEAFKTSGVLMRKSPYRSRRSLTSSNAAAVVEQVVRPPEGESRSLPASGVRESYGTDDSYAFFNRMGRPKYIAAPMVEHSEAAFRYLVRRHGCDLAYTQMIHSGRFAPENAHKFRDQRFDGVDEAEDRPLIVQFCGNDPDTVVQAARHVEGLVDAVDLNLGCPQRIAKKGNYGAFLLPDPKLCESIVSTMSRELSVPVTVKIRASEKESETLDLVRRLEGAGAQMLTVHGRTVRQAKTIQGAANWDIIGKVKRAVSIPVVANGGVETRADAERLLEATGADAVMSSEGLLEDPSLFDDDLTPMNELQGIEAAHRILLLATEYMELTRYFPTPMVSIKGHLFKMLYRLLYCNHDLRDRLAKYDADAAEAGAVVREMSRRYFFDPDTKTPCDGAQDAMDAQVSSKRWYRRHWGSAPVEQR